MNNHDSIIKVAKSHRQGATTGHQFHTEYDWNKAGFCVKEGEKPMGSAPQKYFNRKTKKWATNPSVDYYRDDQVQPIAQAKTKSSATPKKAAPKAKEQAKPVQSENFCKTATLKGNTYLIYDEKVYEKICKALGKAREYKARYEKATDESKRDYFKREVNWYCDHALEIANAYANA